MIAAAPPRLVVGVILPGQRPLFGLDDAPTKRYGPHVEGAGVHHNPTPGPADQKFLYGHVRVTPALPVRHPLGGAIGPPPRAWPYVRRKNIGRLPRRYRAAFRTKPGMAAEAVARPAARLKYPGKTPWIVADGAYAKRPSLKAAMAAGVVVVSRPREDAALWGVPAPPRPGAAQRRGPRPKYGKEKLSLARRAGRRRGWRTVDGTLYGATATKTLKTFLATYPPAGGLIRVAPAPEPDGRVAFCCTDPRAAATRTLEAVADRAAVEQDFHDLKEAHGAGRRLRYYRANVAVFHLNLWLHTPIEPWAWTKTQSQWCDRRDRPWDRADRRPSHADRRNALRRRCVQTEIRQVGRRRPLSRKLRVLCRSLLKLAAWA